jgi:hypothetical protein
MASVSIKNLTTKYGTKTSSRGTFSIEVDNDHYLEVSYTGYKPRIVRIRDLEKIDFLRVKLVIGRTELKAVKIVKPLTAYQKDSVQRAEIYRDILKYEREKSAFSPVSALYGVLSKKARNKQKFKQQVLDMEKQKFIDSRYTPEIAGKITKLRGDDLAYFMNANPMEFDFARTASELALRQWISYKWADYQKKNQGKE